MSIFLQTRENPVFVQFSRKVSSIVDRFAPTDEELASFLSIQQSELDHKKYSPRLVSCGVPYLIVPVWSYETVRNAKFNYSAWSQSIAPQTAAQEILLFAPKTPFVDSDFNARLTRPPYRYSRRSAHRQRHAGLCIVPVFI